MSEIQTLAEKYLANTYQHFPVSIVRGAGSHLWDDQGREYLDLGSGIAVNSFGIADPQWSAAIADQLGKVQHTSNLYYSEPVARLAQTLCERSGMEKVFFSNSGAEANECAIKTARKFGAEKGRFTIATLHNSFHGRTLATLAATGQDIFHQDFLPLTPGFVAVDPEISEVCVVHAQTPLAAVMIEIVQGEGGVNLLELEFLQALADFCAEKDILLIIDEVQTGNGRTGALFAYQNFGITPDIVTTAKGLAGGLPLGATLLGKKVAHVLSAGDHGSTFGGNPVSCAGALNILQRIDDQLLAGVREKEALIRRELTGVPGVRGISGMGLMLGIETIPPAADVVAKCIQRGVLCLTAKNKVRLLPALNIETSDLLSAVRILAEVIRELDTTLDQAA